MNVRRRFAGLSFRLMAFNGLLVFLPLAALLVFDVFESNMLKAQETTMATNARLIAASLISTLKTATQTAPSESNDRLRSAARALFAELERQNPSRLRILDAEANVVADSTAPDPRAPKTALEPVASKEPERPKADKSADAFSSFVYAIGSVPFRIVRALGPPAPTADDETMEVRENPAVRQALRGRYGSWTRVSSGQRSVTLYSAVAISSAGSGNRGVVLVSQSTWRTLRTLYEIRIALFQIFLVAISFSLALSFVLSLTIVRPLKRMREMAEGFIDRWGRPTGAFVPIRGSNELASLSKSLVRLGDGLSEHVRFIESFASDLSHELRNPLASIRTAAELLAQANAEEVAKLSDLIQKETKRIDRIVSLGKDLSRLDVELARAPRSAIDLRDVVEKLLRAWAVKGVVFDVSASPPGSNSAPAIVRADPEFLAQAIDKLIENAVSFSPQPASVRVETTRRDDAVVVVVSDRGPGIDESKLDTIFERFYSQRRELGHTGLGLSLAQTIACAYGGRVRAGNLESGGARFVLELPGVESATS